MHSSRSIWWGCWASRELSRLAVFCVPEFMGVCLDQCHFSKFIDLTIFRDFLKCMKISLRLISWQLGHLLLFLLAVYENKIKNCPVWDVQKYRKRVILLCREETPHGGKNDNLSIAAETYTFEHIYKSIRSCISSRVKRGKLQQFFVAILNSYTFSKLFQGRSLH